MNKETTCTQCKRKFIVPDYVKLSSGPHSEKAICPHCGKYLFFVAKPKNEHKKVIRGCGKALKPSDLDITNCQLCMRTTDMLGTRGILVCHHVIEMQNGGLDEKENIWVLCSYCHSMVHHARTYLFSHFAHSNENRGGVLTHRWKLTIQNACQGGHDDV